MTFRKFVFICAILGLLLTFIRFGNSQNRYDAKIFNTIVFYTIQAQEKIWGAQQKLAPGLNMQEYYDMIRSMAWNLANAQQVAVDDSNTTKIKQKSEEKK